MSPSPSAIEWSQVLGPVVGSFSDSELAELAQATTVHPCRAVRLHPHRSVDDLPFEVETVPWFQRGYFLRSESIRPGEFLHYAAGDYYIQDAGSMLALALCELAPGQWVCDTCASPGGKSTGALELLDGTGVLVANEVIGSRLTILNLALSRAGYANQLVTSLEVDRLSDRLGARFDCVIVDAPCTGQSMVVRGKQSLAAYSRSQIEHSSARQRRIVRAAAGLVKPGGRLVYSTCTFSYEENEQVVMNFVEEFRDWKLKRFDDLAQWETPGFQGCYRLWPHRDRCAGAFGAVAIRGEAEPVELVEQPESGNHRLQTEFRPRTASGSRQWQAFVPEPSAGATTVELPWVEETGGEESGTKEPGDDAIAFEGNGGTTASGRWFLRGDFVHRFASDFPDEWIELASSGVAMAERKEGRFEPVYGSAVVQLTSLVHKQTIELVDQDAAKYVAGEAIRLASNASGWCRVTWRGRPLGWGKLAGGVLKNHYPKALRQIKHA